MMVEIHGEIKKWGNSFALRLSKAEAKNGRLKVNQKVRAIVIPRKDAVSKAFGIFKNSRTLSGQEMKDQIRSELHRM